jgi:hypothetical protein
VTDLRLPPEALHPDEFNAPAIRMVPFEMGDLQANARVALESEGRHDMEWQRHFEREGVHTLTSSGREAIDLALDDIGLGPGDSVLIVTTTGGPYISACVTQTIERRGCRWSRTLGPDSRAILMIHEFGFPARLPEAERAAGLPVIEDCAYAFGTASVEGSIGRFGDYVVYSLPKAIPVSYGGVLLSPGPLRKTSRLSPEARAELPALATHHLAASSDDQARRRALFEVYRARFGAEGFQPLLEPEAGVVPHAFIVALADQPLAERMKPMLHKAGIISSVFYGGGGYFLPNHQRLSEAAVDYVVANFLAAHRQALSA